jgi:3',5'-cyclic AMP phosphodiesterase CpdA
VRLFFASDLHVDVPGNEAIVRELADLAAADRPDVVIIAGDVCNGTGELARTLSRFAAAAPHRIYVPGNHELWARAPGETPARERYYRELPRIARDAGFHPLVTESTVVGDLGFAGTMGWYDYSFADPADGFSEAELRSKRRDGLEWMDGRFVRWTDAAGDALQDRDVTDLMIEDLRDQLDVLGGAAVRGIVVVTHHLAFRGLAPPVFVDGHLKFFRAYLGSDRIGAEAAGDPRVLFAFAGHVHSVRSVRAGRFEARTCPVGYPRERKPGETAADRRLLVDV